MPKLLAEMQLQQVFGQRLIILSPLGYPHGLEDSFVALRPRHKYDKFGQMGHVIHSH